MTKIVDYQVIPATTRPVSVDMDGKKITLDTKSGMAVVKDPGLARAIEQSYGKDGDKDKGAVVVVPRQTLGTCDATGHRTFWGNMPEMPWKRAAREAEEAKAGSE